MIFEQTSDHEQASALPPIPANVREYASKHNVGTPLLLYRYGWFLLWSLIGRALLTVGLLGTTVYLAKEYIYGVMLDQAYPLPDTAYTEQVFRIMQHELLVEALAFAFASSICLAYLMLYWRKYWQKLYLCQNGLLRLGWRKEEAIRWDAVTNMYGSSDRLLALQQAGKAKFVIAEPWACSEEFSRRIVRNLIEYLWPSTLERFNAGIPLSFGPLLVNSTGLGDGGKTIIWAEIENIEEKKGWLTITINGKRRGWESIDGRQQRYQLSNLPLIVALVKQAIRYRLVSVLVARATYMWEEIPTTGK